ncbi:hypothetical protein DFH06DRAFT_1369677, partial [Mycena polygramma]
RNSNRRIKFKKEAATTDDSGLSLARYITATKFNAIRPGAELARSKIPSYTMTPSGTGSETEESKEPWECRRGLFKLPPKCKRGLVVVARGKNDVLLVLLPSSSRRQYGGDRLHWTMATYRTAHVVFALPCVVCHRLCAALAIPRTRMPTDARYADYVAYAPFLVSRTSSSSSGWASSPPLLARRSDAEREDDGGWIHLETQRGKAPSPSSLGRLPGPPPRIYTALALPDVGYGLGQRLRFRHGGLHILAPQSPKGISLSSRAALETQTRKARSAAEGFAPAGAYAVAANYAPRAAASWWT